MFTAALLENFYSEFLFREKKSTCELFFFFPWMRWLLNVYTGHISRIFWLTEWINASIQDCSELDVGFLSDSLPRRTYSDVTLDRLYGGSRRGNTVVVRHNQIPVSLQTHNLSLLYAWKNIIMYLFVFWAHFDQTWTPGKFKIFKRSSIIDY